MDIMEKSYQFVKLVHVDYDYQGFWQRGIDSLENLDFYRGTIRTCRNVLFQNMDHLNWILDFPHIYVAGAVANCVSPHWRTHLQVELTYTLPVLLLHMYPPLHFCKAPKVSNHASAAESPHARTRVCGDLGGGF